MVGTLLGLLTLMYSLMGAMAGVYVYDGDQVGMNGHGYVIRRGDTWYEMHYTFRSPTTLDVGEITEENVDIRPGIWAMTLKTCREDHSVRAFASWNPIDIYRFTFGDNRSLGRGLAPH